MKTLIAFAALALTATIATADPVVFLGCEMTRADNGNYLFKTDPGCVYNAGFGSDATQAGVTDAPAEADADE
jgi:hypothetical protein